MLMLAVALISWHATLKTCTRAIYLLHWVSQKQDFFFVFFSFLCYPLFVTRWLFQMVCVDIAPTSGIRFCCWFNSFAGQPSHSHCICIRHNISILLTSNSKAIKHVRFDLPDNDHRRNIFHFVLRSICFRWVDREANVKKTQRSKLNNSMQWLTDSTRHHLTGKFEFYEPAVRLEAIIRILPLFWNYINFFPTHIHFEWKMCIYFILI